jgi:hypothetical protein
MFHYIVLERRIIKPLHLRLGGADAGLLREKVALNRLLGYSPTPTAPAQRAHRLLVTPHPTSPSFGFLKHDSISNLICLSEQLRDINSSSSASPTFALFILMASHGRGQKLPELVHLPLALEFECQ